jgi:hypothetical protein
VLRLAEEQRLPQGRTEEALRHLVMPRPDVTPALRAVLMRTRCCVELLQVGARDGWAAAIDGQAATGVRHQALRSC